jgi:hypothetical protein
VLRAEAEVAFTTTFAAGADAAYRRGRSLVQRSGAAAEAPARVGMDMGGMKGMAMEGGGAAGGAMAEVAEMHVGVLHVDSMHSHAHMGGGGSWVGHIIPGAFFLLWGSYWAASVVDGVTAAAAARQPFAARCWFPFLPRTLGREWARARALEPHLKVLLPAFGTFVELYFHPRWGNSRGGSHFNGMHLPDGRFDEGHAKYWQHASMYAFFLLSGAVDLGAAKLLPPAAPYAVLSLAFFGEAFLFYFHLQSQAGMLAEIHLLLVYAVAACGVATAVEGATGSANAAYARAFFTLVQGSWFAQIAHTIYGRRPWADDMGAEMMLPVYFCFHLIGWVMFLIAATAAWARYEHAAVLHARGGLWRADAPSAGSPDKGAAENQA